MKILVFLFFEQSKGASVWSVGSGDDSVCGDSYQLYVSQWIIDNTQLTTDRDYAYYYDYEYNDDQLEEANEETPVDAAKNVSVSCGVSMIADEAERTPTCAVLSDEDEEHIVDTSRILGANEAIPHSHPWLAALQIRKVRPKNYRAFQIVRFSVKKTFLQRFDFELSLDYNGAALPLQSGEGRNCCRGA